MIDCSDIPEGYKATELGVLPEEWNSCTLNQNELFEFETGIWKGSKGELVECNILRNTNFRNDGTLNYSDVAVIPIEKRHINKKHLESGDIIIERSGGGPTQPVGRVVFFERGNETFCFSNFTSRLRVIGQKKVDPRFLHQYLFYFHSIGKTNELQQRTTGIRNLLFEDYKKTIIPLPPLPEQRAIAATLRTVQEAKETTDAVIAATKALKAAMMKHLFTFGPVPPEEAERVALKETEIGPVPEGWDVVELKTVLKIPLCNGYALNRAYAKGEVKTYTLTSVTKNDFASRYTKTIGVDPSKLENYWLKYNDLFISRANTPEYVGLAALYRGEEKYAIFTDLLVRVRVDETKVDPKFLMEFLRMPICRQYFKSRLKHTAGNFPKIDQNIINATNVIIPPIAEQKTITRLIETVDQKLAAEQSRKEALDTLFASLLHDLMTAKIRVKSG